MSNTAPPNVTRLLAQWSEGDSQALEALMPVVYAELRRIAGRALRRERGHTLQATALVHEAFIRLVDQREVQWQNRAHFFAIAAQLIRRILVDHARRRGAVKRGCGVANLVLDPDIPAVEFPVTDALALDEALTRLDAVDAQQCRIVEMRYFGGLTNEEIADVLHMSTRTVIREWHMARAWLFRELS